MWMFVVIGFHEIYITALRFVAMEKNGVLVAWQLGKIKTFFSVFSKSE